MTQMSEMVHYIITTNETVLMEQDANDRGLSKRGRETKPLEAEALLVFVCSMEATNLAA